MPKRIKNILSQNIRNSVFIVTDVETTGLNPFLHRITEIALLKVLRGEIIDEFSTLIDPCQFIPQHITRLTGITNEMVYGKPKFNEIIPDIRKFMGLDSQIDNKLNDIVILAGHNIAFDRKFIDASFTRSGTERIKIKPLCTCRLARRLHRSLPSKSLSSLSNYLGISQRNRHRAVDDAKAAALIMIDLLDKLVEEYDIETIDELLSFQYQKIYQVERLSKRLKEIKVNLKQIPRKPGVYYFYSKSETLLYVGKAKNLRERVSTYFYHNTSHSRKVKNLIRHVNAINYETAGSELSALLLESETIKKQKPKYNTAQRRYRRFPFIKIDTQNDYPKVTKVYELKPDGASYYGPFTSSLTVNIIIERINKLFVLRKCDDRKLKPEKSKSPCMYYEIGQCKAPCNFTQAYQDYRMEINRVSNFILSNTTGILKHFEDEMNECSKKLLFEDAAFLRDKISELKKVLLNMELTHTAVTQKNYVVKCRNDTEDSIELFLIKNGRLSCSRIIENLSSADYQVQDEIVNLMDELYFGGSLFGKVITNQPVKYTPGELDKMKIIMNWICQKKRDTSILKINEKTKLKELVKFISVNTGNRKAI
jgi:DNA polymerase III epsilon subunit family exonuclease